MSGIDNLEKLTGVSRVTLGIAVCDPERLVLKPHWVAASKSHIVIGLSTLPVLAVVAFYLSWSALRPVVSPWQLALAIGVVGVAFALQNTTELTLIVRRGVEGIVIERRNRLSSRRSKRQYCAYSAIDALVVEERSNTAIFRAPSWFFQPTEARPTLYYLWLRTPRGRRLLWYTKYPLGARVVLRALSDLAGCPIEGDVLSLESAAAIESAIPEAETHDATPRLASATPGDSLGDEHTH